MELSAEDFKATLIDEEYSRQIVAAENTAKQGYSPTSVRGAYLSLGLSSIKLQLRDGTLVPLGFSQVADSLPNFTENTAWNHLASARVRLTSAVDSILISGRIWSGNLEKITETGRHSLQLNLDLLDAETGERLCPVGTLQIQSTDTARTIRVRQRLCGLEGREVILCPDIKGVARGKNDINYTLLHVHTLLEDSTVTNLKALTAPSSLSEIQLPTVFALHQNYPNPFNPSTEIRFDLPEASTVSLIIYDVLGRQVAELASGYDEAGYHSVTWNATNQASGVYFARFNVADASGNVKYTKINKLVLMK